MDNEPTLYIIMRRDLWDMNPGKGMAQAAHAQTRADDFLVNNSDYMEWKGELGFGRTLVLNATKDEIDTIVQRVAASGFVVDPSYPYRNWYKEIYATSTLTCAWAFPITDDEFQFLSQFELHP